MSRDKIILVDGSLRGASLALIGISLISLPRWDVTMGLGALAAAAICITLSCGVGIIYEKENLPS